MMEHNQKMCNMSPLIMKLDSNNSIHIPKQITQPDCYYFYIKLQFRGYDLFFHRDDTIALRVGIESLLNGQTHFSFTCSTTNGPFSWTIDTTEDPTVSRMIFDTPHGNVNCSFDTTELNMLHRHLSGYLALPIRVNTALVYQ